MKPYPEYKPTGLAWLPEIPKHWDWIMLSQIATEQCNKNAERTERNVLSLSYGRIIQKKNLFAGLSPQDYGTYQIISPGNIVMRLTDLQNDHKSLRTGLAEMRGIITSAYTCLKTNHNPAFLHYLLYCYDIRKVFYGLGGGVRQSIGFKDIRGLRFPFPPADEQAQIVRYLDAMTAKINKLIRAKKRQIALLQEQKQLTPDELETGETIKTPRGTFYVTDMSREQMEAAGYGFHHQSDDGKYLIMGNGTRAFAIAAEQRENPLKAAEQTTEQNENMIDGIINNTPTVDELEAKVKAGETISLVDLANAVKADKERGKAKPEKKPSIRAQLKADKEKAQKKAAAKSKNHDLEV